MTICREKRKLLKKGFSKNTLYRFLNSMKTNWQRFTVLLSSKIINDFMKPITDEKQKDVFIIDDSLFDRSRSKKTELLANVLTIALWSMNRIPHAYFRLVGWKLLRPGQILSAPSSSRQNLLCHAKKSDGRSIAGKRRRKSRWKATDAMLELIESAQAFVFLPNVFFSTAGFPPLRHSFP